MSTVKTPGRGESTVVDSQQPRPGHDLCRHELLPASCAWCTPRAGVEDIGEDLAEGVVRRPGGGPRAASFFSRCPQCDEQIAPGDTIYRSGSVYVCEGCG